MSTDAQRPSLPRRSLLLGAAATAAGGALAPTLTDRAHAAPAQVWRHRPTLTHGVQSGDVTASSATVWTRADRVSRMVVQVSHRPDFKDFRIVPGPLLTPDSDFTGKVTLRDLPAGADVYYRVTSVDLHSSRLIAEPVRGRLRTAPRTAQDIDFLWAGDLAGQGWGIDRDRGGYRIFAAMHELRPDFYLCNGDNIYADGPISEQVALPDGSTWTNVVTEEKSKIAETLAEYRGNYKYNLLDDNLRRFYADVPQIQQWDDHETHNNWYPGEVLTDPAYTEKRVDVLKFRARKAWHEYTPIAKRYDRENRIYRVQHHGPLLDVFVLDMRWYRDPNSTDRQTVNNGGILGAEQARWLKRELAASRATWKVISNDMPLGIVVPDATEGKSNIEAISQGDNGAPLGRELQIAELLTFIKNQRIDNVVWLTTDVHYTAAIHFDPTRAAYTDFTPFWQFVSGPLNAGSFPAGAIDTTFGAQQVFVKAPEVANSSPATEYQFFGQVGISGQTGAMTVRLRDVTGQVLWSTELEPAAR